MRTMTYVCLALLNVAYLGAQEKSSESSGEFLEALRANFSVLEAFDVTVESESLTNQPGGQSGDQTIGVSLDGYARIIVDFPNKKALYLKDRSYTNLQSGAEELRVEATLIVDGTCWHKTLDREQTRLSRNFEESLELLELFDPMQIGLLPFPQSMSADPSVRKKLWDFVAGSANAYGQCEQDAESVKVVITMPPKTGGPGIEVSEVFTHTFDLKTLTPRSLTIAYVSTKEGVRHRHPPVTKEMIKWKEFDGVFMPSSITSSRRSSINGKREYDLIDVAFQWNSINTTIPDDVWDPKRWNDISEIRKACKRTTND